MLGAQEMFWWQCESRQEKDASALLKPGRCALNDHNSILSSDVTRILVASFNQLVGIGISGRNVSVNSWGQAPWSLLSLSPSAGPWSLTGRCQGD